MKIRLLLFGILTELIGETHLDLYDLPDTDAVVSYLSESYPSLTQLNYQIAVNQEIIHGNTHLTTGTTLALMPPFSGG